MQFSTLRIKLEIFFSLSLSLLEQSIPYIKVLFLLSCRWIGTENVIV